MTSASGYNDLAATNLVAQSDYTYDEAGRLTNLIHLKDATILATYAWVYDAANRITQYTSPDGVSPLGEPSVLVAGFSLILDRSIDDSIEFFPSEIDDWFTHVFEARKNEPIFLGDGFETTSKDFHGGGKIKDKI